MVSLPLPRPRRALCPEGFSKLPFCKLERLANETRSSPPRVSIENDPVHKRAVYMCIYIPALELRVRANTTKGADYEKEYKRTRASFS